MLCSRLDSENLASRTTYVRTLAGRQSCMTREERRVEGSRGEWRGVEGEGRGECRGVGVKKEGEWRRVEGSRGEWRE